MQVSQKTEVQEKQEDEKTNTVENKKEDKKANPLKNLKLPKLSPFLIFSVIFLLTIILICLVIASPIILIGFIFYSYYNFRIEKQIKKQMHDRKVKTLIF